MHKMSLLPDQYQQIYEKLSSYVVLPKTNLRSVLSATVSQSETALSQYGAGLPNQFSTRELGENSEGASR